MKSFKHIISYACDKRCSYCINEILKHDEKQCKDEVQIGQKYSELALDGYDHIMLSGGEPVLNKMFEKCLLKSYLYFEQVSIISAHKKTLSHEMIEYLATDVLFSFHAEYLSNVDELKVEIDVPVYASMIVETYDILAERYVDVIRFFKELGYSGMTIRECYPDGKAFEGDIPEDPDFSVRIYKKERCVEDTLLLLPDLSTTTQEQFA